MNQRKRLSSDFTHRISALPEAIFPLLCPVREYEWIERWKCELIFTRSGIAELDCISIATVFEQLGPEVWTCSHYEPPNRIEFVRMSPHAVIRLELTLASAGSETDVTAKFVMTAIDQAGDTLLSNLKNDFKPCFIMLDHYLKTGKMLPGADAAALANNPKKLS